MQRLTSRPIPNKACLPLIGDADRRDVVRLAFRQNLPAHFKRIRPDLIAVMLHPAVIREDLRQFFLGDLNRRTLAVEQESPCARGPLINTQHIRFAAAFSHSAVPCFPFWSLLTFS